MKPMTLIKETDFGTPEVKSARMVTLEIDGRRFTLKPAGNLSEAAKRAEED